MAITFVIYFNFYRWLLEQCLFIS